MDLGDSIVEDDFGNQDGIPDFFKITLPGEEPVTISAIGIDPMDEVFSIISVRHDRTFTAEDVITVIGFPSSVASDDTGTAINVEISNLC